MRSHRLGIPEKKGEWKLVGRGGEEKGGIEQKAILGKKNEVEMKTQW
jgi:hypothetical protein